MWGPSMRFDRPVHPLSLGYRLLLLLCLLAGLAASQARAADARLVIADSQGDWGPLAPWLHRARGPGYVYTSFVFDSLVWKDPQGVIQPLLARNWTSDPDWRCHHFTLNERAQWQDGQPLTAEDVAFTFNYMQQHPYRFVDLSRVQSIQTRDNRVSICLQRPDRLFVPRVAASLPIIPQHIYAQVTDPARFTAPEALIGSGPYRVADYSRAQGFYRLVRNEHWHQGLPRYEEVIINRLSPQAAAAAMAQGEVDVMNITHEYIDLFRNSGAEILQAPSNHPYRLLFNHRQTLASPQLRQGLAHAIDREQLIRLAFHGHALPARPAYRQQGSHEGLNPYSLNRKHAANLLTAAGWQQNAAGQWLDTQGNPIELRLIATPGAERLARVLARQLTDFGLGLSVRLLQDVPLTQAVQQQQFDLALLSQSHQGDPDRFRTLLTGRHARGDQYLGNPRLLELLEALRYQTDPAQREATMFQAEQLYNGDLPSLPLVNPINFAAQRPGTGAAFTVDGIAMGIPLPLNKLALFAPESASEVQDTP